MGFRLSFDFFGETQVDRTLLRVIDAVEDVSPVWEQLATQFARLEQRQFSSQGQHASGGWAPLSPAYAAWKAKNFPGKRILERSGVLRQGLTSRPLAIEVIEPDFMVIGSDSSYGKYHQAGTDRMPRRRPVELTEHARRDWVKRLQRFVITGGIGS